MEKYEIIYSKPTLILNLNNKWLKVYHIRALRDFDDIKAGDLGGCVEHEDNLSHEGNCWIYNRGVVYDNAKIFGDAKVGEYARVFGKAKIYGKARIYGQAKVYSNARVVDGWIFGKSRIYGYCSIGDAIIDGTWVCSDTKIGKFREAGED